MEIKISEVKPEGLELTGSYDPVVLELSAFQITFAEPLKVRLKAQRINGYLNVRVSIKGDMQWICSRCLAKFPHEFSEDFQFDYKIGDEKSIDVTDDVREEILLACPLKILCQDGCKGLCHVCGKNLNEGYCNCPKESFSPFDKLKC